MRVVALDIGRRRTGVAVSDPSGSLARPLTVIGGERMFEHVADRLEALGKEDDGLDLVVVGLPRRADGSDGDATAFVRTFATRLQRRLSCPVHFQDERLTSREAEGLLAVHERDWRKRKVKLDAAAAAVILQEYLDVRARRAGDASEAAFPCVPAVTEVPGTVSAGKSPGTQVG